MRLLIISIFLSLLITGCNSGRQKPVCKDIATPATEAVEDSAIVFKTYSISSDIEGADSLTILTANGNELFRIAEGGNVEILTDTVVKTETGNIGIITLADYFQDNQIFYVLFNPLDSVLLQSGKIYLPYIGMEISQYDKLDSISLVGDSLLIKSRKQPEINLTLALDTLICNSDGIINYYEFE